MIFRSVTIVALLVQASAFVPSQYSSTASLTRSGVENNGSKSRNLMLFAKKKGNGNVEVQYQEELNGQTNGDMEIANGGMELNGYMVEDVASDVDMSAEDGEEVVVVDERQLFDEDNMRKAIKEAKAYGGELGSRSAYPNPTTGAILVAQDGTVLGRGHSDYLRDSVQAVMEDAGLEVSPLHEWCIKWPKSDKLRKDLRDATLYLTLEPSCQRRGQALPPITQLIELSGVQRVVIGSPDPIPELSTKGATALHSHGIEVKMGSVLLEECNGLIKLYSEMVNEKLQRLARKHYKQFKKPLGFLHCSVVDSDNIEAFARHGNAFGKDFDGNNLSFRDFGAYEIAPPPEVVWAEDRNDEPDFDLDVDEDFFSLDFENEDSQEALSGSPMMPWYNQVDAVVATFPPPGNGPVDDDSVTARLNGLKWLATHGKQLPAGVERILVMDATDLPELPLSNDDPNLPNGVDVESFWAGMDRKPTRVLLRRGSSAQAQAAAKAAAEAAEAAAKAALAAKEAIETGDAESAAEAAIECQQAAAAATEIAQKELMKALGLKQKLISLGAKVETVNGGEPIDIMNHLGRRSGYTSVVWRAGCWGNRGVKAIMAGAFQWVSAHIAVDASGGKFWQQMLAERAIQGACGHESKVKVFAGAEDISMEYCDDPEASGDCVLSVSGKPVRHVRLDCRVALIDPNRPREFVLQPTAKLDRKIMELEAPWFL